MNSDSLALKKWRASLALFISFVVTACTSVGEAGIKYSTQGDRADESPPSEVDYSHDSEKSDEQRLVEFDEVVPLIEPSGKETGPSVLDAVTPDTLAEWDIDVIEAPTITVPSPNGGSEAEGEWKELSELVDPQLGQFVVHNDSIIFGLEETLALAEENIRRLAHGTNLEIEGFSCWLLINGGKFPSHVACGPFATDLKGSRGIRMAAFDVLVSMTYDFSELAADGRGTGFDEFGFKAAFIVDPRSLYLWGGVEVPWFDTVEETEDYFARNNCYEDLPVAPWNSDGYKGACVDILHEATGMPVGDPTSYFNASGFIEYEELCRWGWDELC